MTSDQNGNTLKYDAWNRLVSVTNSAGQVIAEYSYDARGYPENGWCLKEIGTGLVSNDDPQGGSGVPAGTTNYPGAAAHTGSGRAGFRGVEHFDWLGSTPVPLNIYYDSQWQAIEVRTNPDWRFRPASGFRLPWLNAAGNVTSQTVWSAAYPGAAAQPRSFVSAGFRAVEAAYNFGPSAGALNINSPVLQDSFSGGVIQPNSRIYFLHDANWNTTAVAGYNATTQKWGVTQRYVYSPYGNIQILNPDWSTTPTGTQPISDYLYQGMTLDAVTGLYYARNRNYSPSIGVWISQDPLQYVNGANTYQMEVSGPVGSVDPSGLLTYHYESDYYVSQINAGMWMGLAHGMDDFRYKIWFDANNVEGEPTLGPVFTKFKIATRSVAPNGLPGIGSLDINAGYFLHYGTQTMPLPPNPDGSHSLLLAVRLLFYHSYDVTVPVPVGPLTHPLHVPTGPGTTYLGHVDDYFIITVDCHGRTWVNALGPGP